MSSTSIFPSTVDRVPDNTACEYNERIRQQTEQRVAHYARQGRAGPDAAQPDGRGRGMGGTLD